MSDPYKVILIGESGVGKDEILNPTGSETLTSQFTRKIVELANGESVSLDIWDTPGKKNFERFSKLLLSDIHAIIFVYDITNEYSFTELKDYWYDLIKQKLAKDVVFAVAGNRCEQSNQQKVSNQTAKEYAESIGAGFFLLTKLNDSGFNAMAKYIAQKILDPNYKLEDNLEQYKSELKNKEELQKQKDSEDGKQKDNKNCMIY